jgi:midasin
MLWSLYVPNIPIDPAAAAHSRRTYLARWERKILTRGEIEYRSNESDHVSLSDGKVDSLLKDLSHVRNLLKDLGTPETRRQPDPAALNALFSELHYSARYLVSDESLHRLAGDLQADWTPTLITRVATLRDSLAALVSRLDLAYAQFDDILRPIRLALASWSIGFSFLLGTARQRAANTPPSLSSYAVDLIRFPAISSADRCYDVDLPSSGIGSSTRITLLRVLAVEYSVACGRVFSTRHVARVRDAYSRLHYLWALDRQREEEEKKQAQSLYRTRDQPDDTVDEEKEAEEEFCRLFPQYEEETESASAHPKAPTHSVTSHDISDLLGAHHRLFLPNVAAEGTPQPFLAARSDMVSTLLPSLFEVLPEQVESVSTPHRLDRLSEAVAALSPSSRLVNFYSDTNVFETQKVVDIIDSLSHQLESLIERWPDQMVLSDLLGRCRAIVAIAASAPVARLLTALELLLPKIDDWQSYASREVSLQVHQDAIIACVVEWRRLELSSWSHLLATEQSKFEERVDEWWFRFYETVGRTPELEGATFDSSAFFRDLVGLLDGFLSAAPVGQYSRRMHLLASFAEYCRRLSYIGGSLAAELATVLDNVYSFYDQFRGGVMAFVTTERKKIEGEINDVVRLASWKDVNVLALKQSAQKSHRQLHKCVRKFRQVLQHPVGNFVTISNMAPLPSVSDFPSELAQVAASSVPALPSSFSHPSASSHLVSLQQTLARLRDLTSSHLGPCLRFGHDASLDDFAAEIIATSDGLRRESPREPKQVKALLNRKRRAWADLLKQLRRIGLTANPSADVVDRQRDAAFIHRAGRLVLGKDPLPAAPACEGYSWRLLALLPRLRSLVGAHHDDIASRDFQKLLGYVESANSLLLEDRRHLAECLRERSEMRQMVDHLARSAMDPMVVPQPPETTALTARKLLETVGHVISAIREARESASRHAGLPDEVPEGLSQFGSGLAKALETIEPIATELGLLVDALDERTPSVTLASEATLFDSVYAELNSLSDAVQKLVVDVPSFAYLSSPLSQWLQNRLSTLSSSHDVSPPVTSDELWTRYATAVDSVLVISKELHTELVVPAERENVPDNAVREDLSTLRRTLALLRPREMRLESERFVTALRRGPVGAPVILARTLPFLQRYLSLLDTHLDAHLRWHRAMLKLIYVVSSTAKELGESGFCKPAEADETMGAADGEKTAGGTGMGEGKGQNNVSNEIEDEEQVEGLQGEDEGDEPEGAEGDDAVEMSGDFGGKEQDMEDAGKEDDESGSEEEGPEAEEQVGDVDPLDPSAVDEKFWGGGDDEEEKKPDNDVTEETAGRKENSEMAARDGERKESDGKEEEAKEEQEADSANDGNPDEPEGPEAGDVHDADDVPMSPTREEQDTQVDMPEAEQLDLPDDLQLAGDQQEDKAEDGSDLDLDGEKTSQIVCNSLYTHNVCLDIPHEHDEPDEEQGPPPADDGAPGDVVQDEDVEMEGEQAPEDDELAGAQEQQASAPQPEVNDAQGGAGVSSATADGTSQAPQESMDATEDSGPRQEQQGASGEAGASEQAGPAAQGGSSRDQGASDQPPQPAEAPSSARQDNTSTGEENNQPPPPTVNPLRSLGDALKEWNRRLDSIADAQTEKPQPETQPGTQEGADVDMEYVEDGKSEDEQAVGPADEEQVQRLGQLRLEGTVEDAPFVDDTEVDMDQPQDSRIEPHRLPIDSEPQPVEDVKAVTGAQLRQSQMPPSTGAETMEGESADDDVAPDRAPEQELEPARVPQHILAWQKNDESLDASSVWRYYQSLTLGLCYNLTEQLRLILEPTLASRLKGDYRSGKRLNMKKIIPYIASEFTKDKIWLRRTRPSQREFQVLVALDDSKSMADSHSIHLAYQTLALVSGALQRLEVGEVGIARFGEDVKFVHGFDKGPVTDDAGAEVIGSFSFDQRRTDVRMLLEQSLVELSRARERKRTTVDLWQLEIIISDGICQDLDAVAALLRKAKEQKVMVVFIVVDSLHQRGDGTTAAAATQHSILDMSSVSYVNGELKMERYLDSFPFEYYVVLRDVEALPEVLSGTLRQFFERVRLQVSHLS